jgi:hypothetical protein
MAKVDQVTNEEEFNAMQERINNCAVAIANPVTSDADKARFKVAYDEMVRKLHYYRHTEMAKTYPGLKQIYKELGYEFDESPVAQEPEPIEPEKPKADYVDWLND